MMRRVPGVPDDRASARFPQHLVVFDGRPFRTYDEYTDAYDDWCDAREAFEAEHEVVLPAKELGECPDPFATGGPDWLPHGGVWSRVRGPDGQDRQQCREHGLAPGEHIVRVLE
jgi:hypothetical protein